MKEIYLNWGAAKDPSEKYWEAEGRAQIYAGLVMITTIAVADKDPKEQQEIMEDLYRSIKPPKEDAWFPFYVAWGRKSGEIKG